MKGHLSGKKADHLTRILSLRSFVSGKKKKIFSLGPVSILCGEKNGLTYWHQKETFLTSSENKFFSRRCWPAILIIFLSLPCFFSVLCLQKYHSAPRWSLNVHYLMVLSVGLWARIPPQTVASRQSQRWWVALGGKANTGDVSEILWTTWQEAEVCCPVGQRCDRSSAPPGRLSHCETAPRHHRPVEQEGELSPSSLYSRPSPELQVPTLPGSM